MKRANGIFAVFVGLAFLVTLIASQASAQQLHDVWFKLNCKFKTGIADMVESTVRKFNSTETIYAYFKFDSYDTTYVYKVEYWAKQTNDQWQQLSIVNTLILLPFEPAKKYYPATPLRFDYMDGSGLHLLCELFPLIHVKKKKMTMKGTGTCTGDTGFGYNIYGHVIINGRSITASKLPFTP